MGKYNLAGLHDKQEDEAGEAQAVTPKPQAKQGREPGKRSRPDFTRTTVYMRDETKLKATRLLQDRKEKRDLSDLIESLVSEWTSKHTDV